MIAPEDNPDLWSEHVTAEDRTYYYNSETKISSWEKPDCLKAAEEKPKPVKVEPVVGAADWKEYETPEGKKYYHNSTTSVTTWEKPAALIEQEKRAAMRDGLRMEYFEGDLDDIANSQLERTDRINMVHEGKLVTAAMYALTDEAIPIFRNTEEAEDAFQKMLKRMGVQADWTWDQCMRACLMEPVWRALPTTMARKTVFEQYLVDVKKATIGKQKNRIEKLKKDFEAMLQKHTEIHPWSRWDNVKKNLENEAAYKSAIDDEEREALFEMYTEKLQEKEAEAEREKTSAGVLALREVLSNMDINVQTRWKEAQKLFADSKEFEAEEIRDLHRFHVLRTFEDYIKYLERKVNTESKEVKRAQARQERKNRDNFEALLNRLKDEGTINVTTKWMDLYPVIKDQEEYKAMLYQEGSSPLDLFWDMREQLDAEVATITAQIEEVLRKTETVINADSDVRSFTELLRSQQETSELDDTVISHIFTILHRNATKQSSESRRAEERRIRRKQDDFRSAMKKLDPPILLTDTYEASRPRLSMLSEHSSLSDEDAKVAFGKYLRRLRERMEDDERRRRRRYRGSERSPKRQKTVSPVLKTKREESSEEEGEITE